MGIEFLNDLKGRIIHDSDKILFEEIITCFSAESYRAVYIMTWICATECLRRKCNEISVHEAETIEFAEYPDEYEYGIADYIILNKSKELGVINESECLRLKSIYELCCIFARPHENPPSPFDCLAAIENVFNLILSKPTLFMYGYANKLVDRLFEDRYMLDNGNETLEEFAASCSRQIHPEVYPYLLESVLSKLEPMPNKTIDDLIATRGKIIISKFLEINLCLIPIDKWNIKYLIYTFPGSSIEVLLTPEFWPLFPEDIQDMLIGHIVESLNSQKPLMLGIKALYDIRNLLIKERHKERLVEGLNKVDYRSLNRAGLPVDVYFHRIIEDLRSQYWELQNTAVRAIAFLNLESFECLSDEQLILLGRNILQAADDKAHSAERFISNNARLPYMPPRLLEGLLLETVVNESGQFRLKSHLNEAVIAVLALHRDWETIMSECSEIIKQSTPVESDDVDQALEILSNLISSLQSDPKKVAALNEMVASIQYID